MLEKILLMKQDLFIIIRKKVKEFMDQYQKKKLKN